MNEKVETLQKVESKMNFLNQKHRPRLSDIELISIDLTSEFLGIDETLHKALAHCII